MTAPNWFTLNFTHMVNNQQPTRVYIQSLKFHIRANLQLQELYDFRVLQTQNRKFYSHNCILLLNERMNLICIFVLEKLLFLVTNPQRAPFSPHTNDQYGDLHGLQQKTILIVGRITQPLNLSTQQAFNTSNYTTIRKTVKLTKQEGVPETISALSGKHACK